MSQARFAVRLGSNKGNIENYEMGRARLPERLAERIGALTGVIPQTLYEGQQLTSYNGRPFSKETFELWKSLGHGELEAKLLIGGAHKFLEILFKAALGPGLRNTPHLFRELMIDLNHFIFSRAERLQLMPVIEAVIRDKHPKRRRKTTVGQLREKLGKHPDWRVKDKPLWADSCAASVIEEYLPLFVPFTTFATRRGCPAFISYGESSRTTYDITIEDERFQVVDERLDAQYLVYRRSTAVPGSTPPSP